jgi:16S rRNA U1498 N3-methylase RsmE
MVACVSDGAPAFDAVLPADDPRACHIIDVLALKVGGRVRIGVVGGMMGDATVLDISGHAQTQETRNKKKQNAVISLRVLNADLCVSPPSPSPVSLVIAMTRPKVFSSQIMSAVSMGVKRIYIIQTARTGRVYICVSPKRTGKSKCHYIIF